MDLRALMGSHLKLRHLILVLAVAEYRSLARTATELFLTQPALSRALREAESAVGVALFERTRHGMVPTTAGVAYLEHALVIVGQAEVLRRRLEELTDPQGGSVSIGAFVTGANLLVPRAVARLANARPKTNVRISEAPPDTLIQELISGDLDLLVGRITRHASTSALTLVPLYREPYRIVAATGHPALLPGASNLADLAAFPWAMPVAGTPLYDTLVDEFRKTGTAMPDHQVECATPAPLRTLVVEAGYLTVMQESMAAADPDFRMHPLVIEGLAQDVGYMLSPDRPLTSAAQLLVDCLHEESKRIIRELSAASP
ncbi:LysR substrate-binding domain-containing protein [Paeniglutamicibacter psychrophenolicus]|uniref:DNA-binding transcriptional LysR family regulator n=1 Tax=Paeniglutamicibacter psychrophenolicus TaxID=257454 RepID=A0ABS4WBE7_9MICC|nr:LysR substrate-binding domain-containing protein [Paeniglutamicibacter psychrophenolicus]MBP2373516.1 DNA-binding transcriptional LysR family regulator [Paeniglutamicibacter psychrophenolicus]